MKPEKRLMREIKIPLLVFFVMLASLSVGQDAYWFINDHGELTGLGDDDHSQYLRADGTRAAASLPVSGSNGIVFQSIQDSWAFKFADGLGIDDTGLIFDVVAGVIDFRVAGFPIWSLSTTGDVTNYGNLTLCPGDPATCTVTFGGPLFAQTLTWTLASGQVEYSDSIAASFFAPAL